MSLTIRVFVGSVGLVGLLSACALPLQVAQAGSLSPPVALVSMPPQGVAGIVPARPEPVRTALKHRGVGDASAISRLREQMHAALGGTLLGESAKDTAAALLAAHRMLERTKTAIDDPQVVLVVDRSPAVQRLWVAIARPDDGFTSVGEVKVSTGKPGRKEHFRTPVGVFDNDGSIVGYRAQGTYNENHIRGIGTHGMRVWDFGWQTTDDWRFKDTVGTMAVRMEMHATDPAVLEPRLGRWDSEGCIRIPSKFNTWLDDSGLIDVKLQEAAVDDRRFRALLPKIAQTNSLSGHLLVVVDTSDPDAPISDPERAAALQHPAAATPEHDDAG